MVAVRLPPLSQWATRARCPLPNPFCSASLIPLSRFPPTSKRKPRFSAQCSIDNRILEELTTPLAPEHFFAAVHGRVYERILALIDRKAVVTPVTLEPYFEADDGLRELGGTAYLARLTADGQGLLARASWPSRSTIWRCCASSSPSAATLFRARWTPARRSRHSSRSNRLKPHSMP